jgi:V8-like Glu-specific endopeptidase
LPLLSTNKTALPYRKKGKINTNAKLVVIGHPSGLPQKVSDDGQILNNKEEDFFVTNLDTFGGNSGSPVVDLNSGMIEGILVRGEEDYIYDFKKGC